MIPQNTFSTISSQYIGIEKKKVYGNMRIMAIQGKDLRHTFATMALENGITHRGATTNGRPSKFASEEAKKTTAEGISRNLSGVFTFI